MSLRVEITRALQEAEQRAVRTAASVQLRESERKLWNWQRGIDCLLAERRSNCFELEVSQDLSRANPNAITTGNSLLVPFWAFAASRDLTAASASGGGYLIGTDVRAEDTLLHALRPASVVANLPVTTMPNLVANMTIPHETASPTTDVLVTEASTRTPTQGTLAAVALAPKDLIASTNISRHHLLQAGGSAYAEGALLRSVGAKFDQLCLAGTGVTGQPLGLVNTPGIGSVAGSGLAEDDLRTVETTASADGFAEAQAYVMPRATASILKGRARVSGGDEMLWRGPLNGRGTVLEVPAFTSDHVPALTMVYSAAWYRAVVATWGTALEVSLNPYQDFKAGIVAVRVMTAFDVGVVTPAAFVKVSGIT